MKSQEYAHVKHLVDTQFISAENAELIFGHIRRATLQHDMRISPKTLLKRIKDPSTFTFDEIVRLSALIDVDPQILAQWALLKTLGKSKKKSGK